MGHLHAYCDILSIEIKISKILYNCLPPKWLPIRVYSTMGLSASNEFANQQFDSRWVFHNISLSKKKGRYFSGQILFNLKIQNTRSERILIIASFYPH